MLLVRQHCTRPHPSHAARGGAILDANYSRKDSEAEVRVKEIFHEVGVKEQYAQYARYEANEYAPIDVEPECDAVLRWTINFTL